MNSKPKLKYLQARNADGTWRYRFKIGGKCFRGNTQLTDEREAHRHAKRLKEEAAKSDTVVDVLEQRKRYLIGKNKVALDKAWALFCKVHLDALDSSDERRERLESHWLGFTNWMEANEPTITMMHDVTEEIAKTFWAYAANHRFDRPDMKPAPDTANGYLSTVRRVFDELAGVASVPINPFAKIKPKKSVKVPRESYTPEEMELIRDKATGWIRYLYMVGIHTGLREGDMCLLKWSDVDYEGGFLRDLVLMKTRRSSGVVVSIPIMPDLREYLQSLPRSKDQEYVYPALAERYLTKSRRGNIGKDFGKWLRSLGIKTDKKVEGRDQVSKVKDVHSLRHTFVYVAGIHKIPMSLVQDIVGHMTPKMTAEYNKHATEEDKLRHFKNLDFHATPDAAQAEVSSALVEKLEAEKAMFAARAEAAASKLELIANMVSMLTPDNLQQVKTMIAQTTKVGETITVEAIPQAQIAQ